MFIPFVPNTTIINKTIVFSDTVLSLKDLGSNIKVTSISNVGEYSFDSCLKKIFESNSDVIFNTIQYSKKDKKVYFYTDEEISLKEYKDSKYIKYKPITSATEILEEVKRVLLLEDNKDENCISLYEVANVLKKLNSDYDMIYDENEKYFKDVIKSEINCFRSLIIYEFDYENKMLKIGLNISEDKYDKIYFTKENEDLYVVKSESAYTNEFFSLLCSELSKLYDELLEKSDYKDDEKSKYCVKSINSNFGVNVSDCGVGIYVENPSNIFINQLELTSPSYTQKYLFNCNSAKVNEVINGNEDEIFRKIFVNICDCPIWCQDMLYELRKNQLEEEQKKEEEIRNKEMKKQKRKELIRKIFPLKK